MQILTFIAKANMISLGGALTEISSELKESAKKIQDNLAAGMSEENAFQGVRIGRYEAIFKRNDVLITLNNLVKAKVLGGDEIGSFLAYNQAGNGERSYITIKLFDMQQVIDPSLSRQALNTLEQASLNIAQQAEMLREKYSNEHPDCPRAVWKNAIANDETQSGYWEYIVLSRY